VIRSRSPAKRFRDGFGLVSPARTTWRATAIRGRGPNPRAEAAGSIVKRSLSELGAKTKAREIGRAVLGLLGRWSADVHLGGTVRSIMGRNIACCTGADTLHRAAQIMWDRDCGAVPVVDADGRLIGVLTDRDICMAAYTQGRPLTSMSVASVLSGRVHSCTPSDSIDDAVAQMRSNRIRRLVVLDGSRHVVGMVSLADLARHVASLVPARREVALVLSELVSVLSEARANHGSSERAAE
jgi:CBS domain-containing protein